MFIKYSAYDYNETHIHKELAELRGISYDAKEELCYMSFGGNFMDVLFKMSEDEYDNFVSRLVSSFNSDVKVFDFGKTGIMEPYDYEEDNWEEHLETLYKLFDKIDDGSILEVEEDLSEKDN